MVTTLQATAGLQISPPATWGKDLYCMLLLDEERKRISTNLKMYASMRNKMVWLMKSRSPNPMEATLRHTTPRVKTLLSPSLETTGPTNGEVATVARWTIPNTGPNSLGVAPLLWASNRIYCLLGATQWLFIRFPKKYICHLDVLTKVPSINGGWAIALCPSQ